MGPLLHDPSVFHDDHAVGGSGLGETVRHHQGGAALRGGQSRALQTARTGTSGFGGGLVQHGQVGVGQNQPGQGKVLHLFGGEPMAPPARTRRRSSTRVPANTWVSWLTRNTCSRTRCSPSSSRGTPPRNTVPEVGVRKPLTTAARVVFPAPLAPTRATRSPGSILTET